MMDELLEQFLIEGRELVAQAAKDFTVLDHDPRDGGAIDSAFRAIHTLKGSFAIFDLPPAEQLLHAGEDLLDQARKGARLLDAAAIVALVACLDQSDRWIDDMERNGTLPPDAEAISKRTIALLDLAPLCAEPQTPPDRPDWLTTLRAREAAVIAEVDTPLTAFRYAPDADCFYRGEDPLAVIDCVPQLAAFTILPAGGKWPALDQLEPFACFSVLEGMSAAPEAEVRAAFRLQPNQVEFAQVVGEVEGNTSSALPHESRILRVESARIDALADSLGDLIIGVNGLAPLAEDMEALNRNLAVRLRAAQAQIERATAKLHRNLAQVRLVPLEPAVRRLPRLARSIAQGLGKTVAFSLSGEAIEVDKEIADALFEPLLHLVRNAIDHGIEMPEMRRANGKEAQGQVTLTLTREGETICAALTDDGAGIDPSRVKETAVARSLISRDDADALSDADALRLIFQPGFSTAASVTEISGRGVGMDAVQTAIARLRGSIEIESHIGRGSRFHIRLPGNALTTRLLVIDVGGERYGVSLDQIAETVRIDASALMPVGSGHACVLRGRTVPVLDLAAILDAEPIEGQHAKLLVTRVDGNPVALRVDGFSERIDTVLRPPRGILASARGVIGSALLGDGGVLLVLDLPELAA